MDRLKEGERVHWTEIKRRANGSIQMSTRKGVVVKATGKAAIVRYRGHNILKTRTQLRREGEHTELTDFVKESQDECSHQLEEDRKAYDGERMRGACS